jgi:kinesin family protein 14
MVIIWELFYLEIISSNNFPSSFKVFSSDRATQSLTIQIACAFEQLVVLIKHWLSNFLPCANIARLEDELKQEVKKLGGYLQLFLQVN